MRAVSHGARRRVKKPSTIPAEIDLHQHQVNYVQPFASSWLFSAEEAFLVKFFPRRIENSKAMFFLDVPRDAWRRRDRPCRSPRSHSPPWWVGSAASAAPPGLMSSMEYRLLVIRIDWKSIVCCQNRLWQSCESKKTDRVIAAAGDEDPDEGCRRGARARWTGWTGPGRPAE